MMRRFAAVLLVSISAHVPFALAQDASRVDQLEEQIRQLTGQVEELTFAVKQLQGRAAPMQKSEVQQLAPAKPKMLAQVPAEEPLPKLADGIEVIEEKPLDQQAQAPVAAAPEPVEQQASIYGDENLANQAAPAPATLTSGRKAAQPNDGGFQGQVLVTDGTESPAITDGSIQQVSLAQETPEDLYKRSDEALLRRKFDDAESGFKTFLNTYPDHSLAGSAKYWLGETFYAQGDYKSAAQNFLEGYQKYPKSRRAPDSLLKLGIALNKLGQKDQACSFLGSVSSEYPRAVEANKRAQTEFKRAGC